MILAPEQLQNLQTLCTAIGAVVVAGLFAFLTWTLILHPLAATLRRPARRRGSWRNEQAVRRVPSASDGTGFITQAEADEKVAEAFRLGWNLRGTHERLKSVEGLAEVIAIEKGKTAN